MSSEDLNVWSVKIDAGLIGTKQLMLENYKRMINDERVIGNIQKVKFLFEKEMMFAYGDEIILSITMNGIYAKIKRREERQVNSSEGKDQKPAVERNFTTLTSYGMEVFNVYGCIPNRKEESARGTGNGERYQSCMTEREAAALISMGKDEDQKVAIRKLVNATATKTINDYWTTSAHNDVDIYSLAMTKDMTAISQGTVGRRDDIVSVQRALTALKEACTFMNIDVGRQLSEITSIIRTKFGYSQGDQTAPVGNGKDESKNDDIVSEDDVSSAGDEDEVDEFISFIQRYGGVTVQTSKNILTEAAQHVWIDWQDKVPVYSVECVGEQRYIAKVSLPFMSSVSGKSDVESSKTQAEKQAAYALITRLTEM